MQVLRQSKSYTLLIYRSFYSNLEVSRYIETYKALEGKSADTIKEQVKDDYEAQVRNNSDLLLYMVITLAQLTDCLTAVRSINKRNVQSLVQNIGVSHRNHYFHWKR